MKVEHHKEKNRFTMEVSGQEAHVDYIMKEGKMHLVYSEVPQGLRGRGIGKALVEGTFEKLTEEGFKAVPVCSFIRMVARRSDKWKGVIG